MSELVNKLLLEINECIKTPLNELLQNINWGNINFNNSKNNLERTFKMLSDLKLFELGILPDVTIQKIIDLLKNINSSLNQIRSFNITSGTPQETCQNIVEQINEQANNFFNYTYSYISFLAFQNGDYQRNIKNIQNSYERMNNEIDDNKKSIIKKHEEIDKIVINIKETAGSVGVAHFSTNFNKESENYEKYAKNWLITTITCFIITFIVFILFIYIVKIESITTISQIIQYFTSKFIIIGILFSITIWCGKIYKITRHQSIINKHRSNALLTFQAFTNAANDISIRDAVLMETTKSIFTISPSGYLDTEINNSNDIKVIEIMKSVSQMIPTK